MNDSNLTSDRFSWRRVWLFGSLFSRELKWAAGIYSVMMLLCYLLSMWLWHYKFIGGIIIVFMLVGYAIYALPLLFAFTSPSVGGMLPVKPVERWAFLMIFALLLGPVSVELMWYLPAWIGHIAFGWPAFGPMSKELGLMLTELEVPEMLTTFGIIVTGLQIMVIYIVEICGVFSARRHPFLRGLGFLAGYECIICIMSMLWGFWLGFKAGFSADTQEAVDIAFQLSGPLMIGLLILSVVVGTGCTIWLLRTLKRRQYA